MNKYFVSICIVAILALAAINVNLAVKSDVVANLSLANIVALATGESGTCSICGRSFDGCICPPTITCDQANCYGRQCHQNTGNSCCPCERNGNQYSYCNF